MASGGKISDDLPPGWKEFVQVKNGRKIKYFANSATGKKFYSKKSVLQFVNSQSQETSDQGASPSTNIPVSESIPCKNEATPSQDNGKKDESLEWLPSEWTVECRARKSGSSTYEVYTDPSTKCKFYSKPQALQYLKGIEGRNAGEKEPQFIKQQEDISQYDESVENENEMGTPLLKDVEENTGLNELPPVHTQAIKMRNRGHGISKGQDTCQASESLEGNNHISGENQNENDKDRPSLSIVLYEPQAKNGSNELPPGWIKKIKSRKRGSATKSDSYYIDTASGYAFYSKKDVARYLESEDIRSCAIRPHKWDLSELKLMKEDTHHTSQASDSLEGNDHISGENQNENDKDKPSLSIVLYEPQAKNGSNELPPGWIKKIKSRKRGSATRSDSYYIDTASGYAFYSKKDVARYLETGDIRSCAIRPRKWDLSELQLMKEDTHPSTPHDGNKSEESAKDKEGDGMSRKSNEKDDSVPTSCSKLTASTIEEKPSVSGTENGKHEENSGSNAECSKQGGKIVPDNVAAKSTNTDGIHEQKLPENGLDTKTKKEKGKSKKRKLPSTTPCRSSKRLAGREPEVRPNYPLSERAAVRKHDEVEADRSSGMAPNAAADEVPQQPVPEVERTVLSSLASSSEVPQLPLTEAETTRPSNLAPSPGQADIMAAHNSSICAETSLGKDFDINLEAPSDKQVLQGDFWSDPCWDFAFKTLTGAIPLEDTLQGYLGQQTDTSYAQDNLNFVLPEFEIFQSDVPRVDPVQNNPPAGQPSTNPSTEPPGNLSLPSSQPPSFFFLAEPPSLGAIPFLC